MIPPMSKQRVVSSEPQPTDELPVVPSLRPRTLDAYIGQADLREKLRIALEAVKQRGDAMEHVLLYGPPGLEDLEI